MFGSVSVLFRFFFFAVAVVVVAVVGVIFRGISGGNYRSPALPIDLGLRSTWFSRLSPCSAMASMASIYRTLPALITLIKNQYHRPGCKTIKSNRINVDEREIER